MPPIPFSQDWGASHGRTEAFSGSVLEQPVRAKAIVTENKIKTKMEEEHFISYRDAQG